MDKLGFSYVFYLDYIEDIKSLLAKMLDIANTDLMVDYVHSQRYIPTHYINRIVILIFIYRLNNPSIGSVFHKLD